MLLARSLNPASILSTSRSVAMSSEKLSSVTLYDLPTKGDRACGWSPNVWKTRLVLNYKNIPYKTHWTCHHDIGSTLEGLGIAANPPRTGPGPPVSPYTVPAIQQHPAGDSVMDSLAIAERLEAAWPTPSLRLESRTHVRAQEVLGKLSRPLLPIIMPAIARNVMPDDARPRWVAKREAMFGPLDQFEATKGGEAAWEAARPGFQELSAWLSESSPNGPFILGEEVSYGDFVLVAMAESMRRVVGEEVWARMLAEEKSGRLKGMYEAAKEEGWLRRDD